MWCGLVHYTCMYMQPHNTIMCSNTVPTGSKFPLGVDAWVMSLCAIHVIHNSSAHITPACMRNAWRPDSIWSQPLQPLIRRQHIPALRGNTSVVCHRCCRYHHWQCVATLSVYTWIMRAINTPCVIRCRPSHHTLYNGHACITPIPQHIRMLLTPYKRKYIYQCDAALVVCTHCWLLVFTCGRGHICVVCRQCGWWCDCMVFVCVVACMCLVLVWMVTIQSQQHFVCNIW